jgi:hypothetical protein
MKNSSRRSRRLPEEPNIAALRRAPACVGSITGSNSGILVIRSSPVGAGAVG